MENESNKVQFTAKRVAAFECKQGKQQAFFWDEEVRGLGVRVTSGGAKAYIHESKLNGRSVRLTIGQVLHWFLDDARKESRRLQTLIDQGTDPREIKAEKNRQAAQAKAIKRAESVLVGHAWNDYIEAKKGDWGDRHYKDHLALAKKGGDVAKRGTRGKGVTIAGPLYSLMGRPLKALDTATIEHWAAREGKSRPTQARLAWRCLKAFIAWCATHDEFKAVIQYEAAKSGKTKKVLGKAGAKSDVIEKGQLSAWFGAVRKIDNPVIAAYLQSLLLTGARSGELIGLKWTDIQHKWKSLTIRDKVEGERQIPLTEFVEHLLVALPRRNEWVFSSVTAESGRITSPNSYLTRACNVAGIEHLTLHGLRRSFGSLGEWCETPSGVTAQIMGHKPSAIAEKHYRVRPLDMLRVHHQKFESWVLEQAGVEFNADETFDRLRVVA